MKQFLYILFFLFLSFSSLKCRKDKPPQPIVQYGKLYIQVSHFVDSLPLIFDSLLYKNAEGNNYSVSTLKYYLGNFSFTKSNGVKYYSDKIFYIDAQNISTCKLFFDSFSLGNYTNISFNLGIDSQKNISHTLPATPENINMEWPDGIGGGYHFIKFEGTFNDTVSQNFGYTIHIGKNENLMSYSLQKNFTINASDNFLDLKMNINEWFTHPAVYDFNKDANHTMNNDAAMKKLHENAFDIFY